MMTPEQRRFLSETKTNHRRLATLLKHGRIGAVTMLRFAKTPERKAALTVALSLHDELTVSAQAMADDAEKALRQEDVSEAWWRDFDRRLQANAIKAVEMEKLAAGSGGNDEPLRAHR